MARREALRDSVLAFWLGEIGDGEVMIRPGEQGDSSPELCFVAANERHARSAGRKDLRHGEADPFTPSRDQDVGQVVLPPHTQETSSKTCVHRESSAGG